MSPAQKQACSSAAKYTLSFGAGIIATAFTMGATLGTDRSEFKEASTRSRQNSIEIQAIKLQMAEDRVVTRHMLEMLNEVRNDVRAIRAKAETSRN